MKAAAEKHGLPYYTKVSFIGAIRDHVKMLKILGREDSSQINKIENIGELQVRLRKFVGNSFCNNIVCTNRNNYHEIFKVFNLPFSFGFTPMQSAGKES